MLNGNWLAELSDQPAMQVFDMLPSLLKLLLARQVCAIKRAMAGVALV
jgi:hypothetical protein